MHEIEVVNDGIFMFSKFIVVIGTTTLVFLVYAALLWHKQIPVQTDPVPESPRGRAVPFVYISTKASRKIPPFKALYYSLDTFHNEVSQAVQGLSMALEQALELETGLGRTLPTSARLSKKLEGRIQKMSDLLEKEERTLKNLLQPFDYVVAIAQQPWLPLSDVRTNASVAPDEFEMNHPPRLGGKNSTITTKLSLNESAYDSAGQVVAHLVRDWTPLGASIRESLYGWCLTQLEYYLPASPRNGPVLVPGAGLGRLAYDISLAGYVAEANELSPVMATAAHAVLERQVRGTLHPFLLDAMSNEVEVQRRYDSVEFPDTVPTVSRSGALSFTIGDFAGDYYSSPVLRGAYSAVVTSFFLDTAANVYEYIQLLRDLIRPGGFWINVGPLQWHQNALLFCAVDELKDILPAFGFVILQWEVDKDPIPYRQDESNLSRSFVRTTNMDAYRPLRFVARRQ